MVSRISTGQSCASPRRTCRSPSRHRSNRRYCRASTASRRHAVSSSLTETSLVDVTMPQMGVSVAEGTIIAWRVAVGDPIEAEQTILEISTDKIDSEVPAPVSGTLAEILVEPDQTVDVGTVLGRIATAADAAAPAMPATTPDSAPAPAAPIASPTPARSSHDRRYSP